MVLRLDEDGNVKHRYLWGPMVDQLLADEQIDTESLDTGETGTAGDELWALGDHLNSIRDLVRYDAIGEEVELVAHRTYDSFGNVDSGFFTDEAVDFLFGFTGPYWWRSECEEEFELPPFPPAPKPPFPELNPKFRIITLPDGSKFPMPQNDNEWRWERP